MDKRIREFLAKIGSVGGKRRAARYSKATLRKWAKLGGRPRKSAQADEPIRKGVPK